jgi:hypothetical protein
MDHLLKRARSAGLGLLLATQSLGDFDYSGRDPIRSWFGGQVKQGTALAKMRPMLRECLVDGEAQLPGQGAGEFHLSCEGSAPALRAGCSALQVE